MGKNSTGAVEVLPLNFAENIQKPSFKEDKKSGIVRYGDDNLYPDFLLDLFVNKSNKHHAIINRKVSMISGQGFEAITDPTLQGLIDNFRGSHPMEDMVKLLSTDLEVFNAFAYLVRWNEDKSKIAAIDYVPVHKVRKGLAENTWYVSDNWKHYKKEESNTKMYKSLDPSPVADDASDEERRLGLIQMVYFGNLSIGTDCYPHVEYQSAINYIAADYEISKFTLNNIKNNFVGGYHVGFRGDIPEADERADVKKSFTKEYTGSEASSIIFTWNEAEGNATTFTPLPTSGSEDAFLAVEQQVRENIFVAHGITNPLLMGIMVPGSLGGKDELQESLEIFNITSIRPKQSIIERSLSRIGRINGSTQNLILAEYTFIDKAEETNPENV